MAITYDNDSYGSFGFIGSLQYSLAGGDLYCYTCHDIGPTYKYYRTEINFSLDCISCHDIGGIAGTGRIINSSAMNDSNAIHRNLNNGVITNLSPENKKCWACHGNGQEYGDGHPPNYKTPYRCPDCHVPSPSQNFNFTPPSILNVIQHYWNGTNIITSNVSTCYDCHNKNEMMLGEFDPDGQVTGVYNGSNGGNGSSSHYGKKRTDYSSLQDTNDYCYKCHYNTSTVFPFMDYSNKLISNHSFNNPSTNPACRDCHFTGRIHNSTLSKPTFTPTLAATYCQNCHPDKQKHNNSLDCSTCHINSTSTDTIHPIKYLQTNSQFTTTNSSAVTCTCLLYTSDAADE